MGRPTPTPLTPAGLAAWLAQEGVSPATLAARLGVSRAAVYHWRTGARPIPPYLHLALATLARRRA